MVLKTDIPEVSEKNFTKAADFGATHSYVDSVQGSALDALKKAFSQFPVTVRLASSHKGSIVECLLNAELPGCSLPNEQDWVYVSGPWTEVGTGSTGGGVSGAPQSVVFYWVSLQNVQSYLKLNPLFPPVTNTDRLNFATLLQAVGIGIGNAAAHEMGHHVAYKFYIKMDCSPNQNSANACQPDSNNDVTDFEIEGGIKEEYMYVYPQIHWQPDSVCAIQQYFGGDDWRDANCTRSFKKPTHW